MSAEFHAGFQASGFAMGRAFAEVPVDDVALDSGCWPFVDEDGVGTGGFLLGIGVGVLTDSMKVDRGPGVSTVGLKPEYGRGAASHN